MFDAGSKDPAWSEETVGGNFVRIVGNDDEPGSDDCVVVIILLCTITVSIHSFFNCSRNSGLLKKLLVAKSATVGQQRTTIRL